jgi:GDP-L-fucose synthase
MEVSRLERLGWKAKVTLEEGLFLTYEWFLAHQENFRK